MTDENLKVAIDQIESGNLLVLLDSPAGRANLLAWLQELYGLRTRDRDMTKRRTLSTLTDFHGLTMEEALRVWARLEAGHEIEWEEGPCRKCGGVGKVDDVVDEGCFGPVTRERDCMTCYLDGKKRVKVPEPEPEEDEPYDPQALRDALLDRIRDDPDDEDDSNMVIPER